MPLKPMVIERVGGPESYAGRFLYEDKSIHKALEKHEIIVALMKVLKSELPEYDYTLEFIAKEGTFTNELTIIDNGAEGEDYSRDSFRHALEEAVAGGNSELPI